MKFYLAMALFLATSSVAAETCGADDVIVSIDKVSADVSYMEGVTEAGSTSIADDSPIIRDTAAMVQHFQEDLQCEIVIEDPVEQQRVCDAYAEFAAKQKESLDAGFDESFLKANKEQPEAGEMHSYTDRFEKALTGYTDRIKAGVPECADQIAGSYGPVQEDMAALLVIYPAEE